MQHEAIPDVDTFVRLARRNPAHVLRLAEDQWTIAAIARSPIGDGEDDVEWYLEKARGGRRTWKTVGPAVEWLLAHGVDGFTVIDNSVMDRQRAS